MSQSFDTPEPLTSPTRPQPDVMVVGAGLAGLTAAALLARAGVQVRVLERHRSVGGFARSTDHDGFVFNQGPHALYRGGEASRVLQRLGIAAVGGPAPANGYVAFDGETHSSPVGAMSLMRTGALKARDKVALGALFTKLPKLDPAELADTTVADWIDQQTSSLRVADLLHAFVRLSTYANCPDVLSADVALSQLQLGLAQGVLYLDRGWQTLVDRLRSISGFEIATEERIDQLPDARVVICAVGGPGPTAALLGKTFDVGPPAKASCLDLGVAAKPPRDFVLGGDSPFYFSNHSASADLAPAGNYHASVAQYLAPDTEPDAAGLDDFARLAGVDPDAARVRRNLHRMTTVTAVPIAAAGGMQGRPPITDTGHSNVLMAGDWIGPTGHLADASLASAEAAATAALGMLGR